MSSLYYAVLVLAHVILHVVYQNGFACLVVGGIMTITIVALPIHTTSKPVGISNAMHKSAQIIKPCHHIGHSIIVDA